MARHRPTAAEAFTRELEREQRIANDQRVVLFRFLLISAVVFMLLALAVATLVGLGILKLATPIVVGLISAMFVTSSVPLGFMARGLFMQGKSTGKAPADEIE